MKLIPPSATIIENELNQLSLIERLEQCGRICYKSEEKITPGSAEKFVRGILKNKHMSVLEMARFGISGSWIREKVGCPECGKAWGYLTEDEFGTIWGSIRAFYETEINAIQELIFDILFNRRSKECIECQYGIKIHLHDPNFIAVRFVVGRHTGLEFVRHRPMSWLQESQRYCRYDGGLEIITPSAYNYDSYEYSRWLAAMESCETAYRLLREPRPDNQVSNGVFIESEKRCSPQAARTVLPNSTKTELIGYTRKEHWQYIFNLRDSPAADPSMQEVMKPLHKQFTERGLL